MLNIPIKKYQYLTKIQTANTHTHNNNLHIFLSSIKPIYMTSKIQLFTNGNHISLNTQLNWALHAWNKCKKFWRTISTILYPFIWDLNNNSIHDVKENL